MFVVTDEGVIAIESVNTNHAKEMVAAIKAVTDKPIRYLLHSHNHWDHASGGKVFHEAGATVMAHEEAYRWMKANTGPDMMVPDQSWAGNRKDITLGGTVLELHYLGMNHGLGMTVFLLPKEKIAYIADLVDPQAVLFNIVPDFNIKEWERSLKEVEQMDFDKAVLCAQRQSAAVTGRNQAGRHRLYSIHSRPTGRDLCGIQKRHQPDDDPQCRPASQIQRLVDVQRMVTHERLANPPGRPGWAHSPGDRNK